MSLLQRSASRVPIRRQVRHATQMRQEAGSFDERANRTEHIGAGMHRLAVDVDRARVWPNQADQHANHCRLARAVRTEQSHHLTGLSPEGHTVDRPEPVAVGLDHLVDHQRDAGKLGDIVNRPATTPQPQHSDERGKYQRRNDNDQRDWHVQCVGIQCGRRRHRDCDRRFAR